MIFLVGYKKWMWKLLPRRLLDCTQIIVLKSAKY